MVTSMFLGSIPWDIDLDKKAAPVLLDIYRGDPVTETVGSRIIEG
jgi:hypothetical protein|tara:strand:+ start:64 stop:198 length:135 start_codon:yes stop_codon:yes gene_type:complete